MDYEEILIKLTDLRSQPVKCSCGKVYGSPGALSRHILSKPNLSKPEDHKGMEVVWRPEQKRLLHILVGPPLTDMSDEEETKIKRKKKTTREGDTGDIVTEEEQTEEK